MAGVALASPRQAEDSWVTHSMWTVDIAVWYIQGQRLARNRGWLSRLHGDYTDRQTRANNHCSLEFLDDCTEHWTHYLECIGGQQSSFAVIKASRGYN